MKSRLFRTLLCSIVIFVFTTHAAAQSTQSPTFTIQSYPLLGNSHIAVDLNAGGVSTVTITSTQELSPSEIGEAVAEAGYLVVANEA